MTTRLPLRVEPLPGEWWRGYVNRVAVHYRVHPFDLMRTLDRRNRFERRHMRWLGIAVTEGTALRLGTFFNLAPPEIHAMHLRAYNGSVLNFGDLDPATFDLSRMVATDRLPMGAIGPLVQAARDRYCPECLAENPDHLAMSWRLHAHLVCTRHRTLLTGGAHRPMRPVAIADEVVAGQNEVLSRLSPSVENAAFFNHFEAQLKCSIPGGWLVLARRVQETPEQALHIFESTLARVTSPGFPDYQGLADWPPYMAARYLRPPRSLGFGGSREVFPRLLPMSLFVGGLSDLLHRAQIRQARAIAAVGALMSATGDELGSSVVVLPTGRTTSTTALLLEHLTQMEREGRAEQFWALCAAAAADLIHEGIDYRHREQVCTDEEVYLVARSAEPSAYCRTVRTWLVDQWACTYTSSNVRPSVRDGSIEHYDRLYGPGMRAALERLPGRAVA